MQYRLGQIYMVAKVCSELTDVKDGAGVESIANENMPDIPEAISKFPTFSSDMCTSSCIYTKKFVRTSHCPSISLEAESDANIYEPRLFSGTITFVRGCHLMFEYYARNLQHS
jgi:hypothetical protein